MPELPEVESVRLTLAPELIGRRVVGVRVRRRDVVDGAATARALLAGERVAALERLGKQLAIFGESGRVVVVQLGMSGQLTLEGADAPRANHVHVEWVIERSEVVRPRPSPRRAAHADPPPEGEGWRGDAGVLLGTLGVRPLIRPLRGHLLPQGEKAGSAGARAGRPRCWVLRFRDPRRFGGVWVGGSRGELIEAKWGALGPDAAGIGARVLRERLGGARRGLKAALMDQGVVAGLGNIYTDESLHRAGLSPVRRAGSLRAEEHEALARAVRATLRAGVRGGGSSLRDGAYVNGRGEAGSFQTRHRVYGRGGEPCLTCGETLRSGLIAQRTTVWCPKCQR